MNSNLIQQHRVQIDAADIIPSGQMYEKDLKPTKPMPIWDENVNNDTAKEATSMGYNSNAYREDVGKFDISILQNLIDNTLRK